jgi:hypothetical protein
MLLEYQFSFVDSVNEILTIKHDMVRDCRTKSTLQTENHLEFK